MYNRVMKVSLKDLPEVNEKRENSANYRTKSEATITTNSHQHPVNKTFSSTDAIINTITYADYKTENNLVFSSHGLGLVNNNLGDEEEKYDIPKVVRDALFDVCTYLRGQFSDIINATTVGKNLDCLKLTIQIPGGVEAFSNI